MTTTKKRARWTFILLATSGLIGVLFMGGMYVKNVMMTRPNFWEWQIKQYERRERRKFPPKGGILFIGSSSIRYWKTLKRDMKPLPVINRGFGGSHIRHILHYDERIVFPYKPKIVVIYSGENDLSAGVSVEKVVTHLELVITKIRQRLPGTRFFYISIKPSLLRYRRWPLFKVANASIKSWIATQKDVEYIDVSKAMHTSSGRLRRDIFVWDRLHMNRKGYKLWTPIVRTRVMKTWQQLNSKK